ncbi:biotin-dependent carboxyltransferase family protein [Treponema sp. TIM-1]|uniref:5-oxoprolinase subunit C family protein n=1 Tax=Treponema sp. TIM-1 TaxID=2898417 RepID=UPI00397F6516
MGMKIIGAGPLTTVQDRGRLGFMAMGFSPSGAMDDFSLSLANILAGNDEGEAVLEITMAGISAVFDGPAVIALTGADISPAIDGKPAAMNRALVVGEGSVFSSAFARGGCRSYLAVAGGLDLPLVLGSRSTNLKVGIGGLDGRKLQDGDYLPFRAPCSALPDMDRRVYEPPAAGPGPLVLHVVPGVQEDRFSPGGIRTFYTSVYTLSPDSDRMGIRFTGPPVESKRGTDIVSDGIAAGAVQIPNSGQPLVLMRDRQTIGGYAKIGTVAGADLAFLAQLFPGMPVRFKRISLRRAEGMYFRRLKELRGLKKKIGG